jgi:hypothetical protein
MQKQIAAQAVTEKMRMEFVDTEGLSTPLDAEFEYNPADPFAVSILFADEPAPVRWTFARDLLIEGFYEPTGDGDVHVWPCLDTAGAAVVIVELDSPDGRTMLQFPSRAVHDFASASLATVSEGAEQHDIDAWIEQLLTSTEAATN